MQALWPACARSYRYTGLLIHSSAGGPLDVLLLLRSFRLVLGVGRLGRENQSRSLSVAREARQCQSPSAVARHAFALLERAASPVLNIGVLALQRWVLRRKCSDEFI